VDGKEHHGRLVAPHPRNHVGGEQLRQLPPNRMDGGYQPNQRGGLGKLADEEGKNSSERAESDPRTKTSAIQEIDNDVVAEMPAERSVDGCHPQDSTSKTGDCFSGGKQ
jgi:hypothetical protein